MACGFAKTGVGVVVELVLIAPGFDGGRNVDEAFGEVFAIRTVLGIC